MTDKVLRLIKKAENYLDKNDIKTAITVLQQVVEGPVTDATLKRKAFNLSGLAHYKLGNLEKAESHFLQALSAAEATTTTEFIYTGHDNLAAVYISSNRTQEAMKHLQLGLQLKERSGNEKDMARGYIQLASLHLSIDNLPEGKAALVRTKELIKKYKQPFYNTHWHFANGTLFKKELNWAGAKTAYTQAVKYATQYKEPYLIARSYYNRGDVWLTQKKWKEAELDFLQSLKVARENNLQQDELMTQCQLARVAFHQGKYEACNRLLQEVSSKKELYQNDQMLLTIEEITAQLHEKTGKPEHALLHYRGYMEVYKRFYDKEQSRTILDLQAKYESEKKERELKEARLREVESELKALRSQMNPHFVFNAIGSIRHTLLEGNTEQADKQMLRFSRLLRLILDSSRKPEMLLSENIELLNLYIQTEQARYSKPFDYTITVEKGIKPDSISISGLILQPVVENSIVHGLFHKTTGKGKLAVNFKKAGNLLEIDVTDNGIGRKEAAAYRKKEHTSHAISIIRETLQLIWKQADVSNYFVIKDLKNAAGKSRGTTVIIKIPLNK